MQYTLYTDGACSGNPGPGGYAAILVAMDDAGAKVDEREIVGGEAHTTNNRMEITAVLEGLRALQTPSKVMIVTDSEYVMKTMTKGWKRNKNGDLWEQMDDAIAPHRATWKYVKGHAGHDYNERCDQLAVQASRQYRK